MGAFIEITDLRKHFVMGSQTVKALDGIDLEIPEGSFTIIMGPSGSGKSTLLYLIGGLDRPTSGSIRIGGKAIEQLDENDLAIHRRQTTGFVFQSFNLISSMNAVENVGFPMRFSGKGNAERQALAAKLLKQVGLQKRAHHKPTELSGGQQQRVAIARALVNDPSLILADEPTGNLDTASGLVIMQMLADLHKQGRTIVVVSHDPRVLQYATQVVYILDGLTVDRETYEASTTAAYAEPLADAF